MQSLEKSKDTFLEKIDILHKMTTDALNQLKKNTIQKYEKLLENRKKCVKADIDHCEEIIPKMQGLQNECRDFEEKNHIQTLILYNKLCDQNSQTRKDLDKLSIKNEVILEFHPNESIEQKLSTLSGRLGDVIENVKQASIVKGTKQAVEIVHEKILGSDQVAGSSNRSYQSDQQKGFNMSNPESMHGNETGDEKKPWHVLVSDSEKKMQFGWKKNDRHSGMVVADEGKGKVKVLTQTFELAGHSKK